jgi:hypothetical protein
MSEMSGMESGTQENVGRMPAGPEPYNPSGQEMPTDGGNYGTNAAPSPGDVASPDVEMPGDVPTGGGEHNIEAYGIAAGGQSFANMPTPDN